MTREARRAMFHAILARVTDGAGQLASTVRRAAADGAPIADPALAALADTIRNRAVDVTSDQLAAARAAGYDDDQLYEFTIATALGASRRRLAAVMRALGRE